METKEQTIRKIQTAGKVTRIVALVLCILAFIAAGCCFVSGIAFACVPESWLQVSVQGDATFEIKSSLSAWKGLLDVLREKGTLSFEYGELTVGEDSLGGTISSPFLSDMPLTKLMSLGCLSAAFQTAIYAVILLFISRFGKVLQKSETPFSPKCIRFLKIAAYVLLVWSVVSGIINVATRGLITGHFMAGYSLDFGMLLLALAFLMVVYIFQYGAKLQQESDETL